MFVCVHLSKFVFVYILFVNLWKLNDGESCLDRTGKGGICVALSNCDHALNLINQRTSPTFCYPGTEANFNALVCCPTSGIASGTTVQENQSSQQVQRTGERISFTKCKEYNPDYFDDDTFHITVVGGEKALPQEYKHMALVGYGDKEDIKWNCGGSLISEKYVLTAAHCIETNFGTPDWVRLGELDTSTTTDDANPEDFAIVKTVTHPNYQSPAIYHDIGLLELDRNVKFTEYTKPACLYQSNQLSDYPSAIATGWGHTLFAGKPSSHLMEVRLDIVNATTCNRSYRGVRKTQLPKGIVDSTQICAGGNDEKDTCQGDSGGPLQVLKKVKVQSIHVYDIVGITSFGITCGLANTAGVYTRVFNYLDWIEKIVWQ